MRENMGLYRGKRLDNRGWVEGWLVIKKDPVLEITYCFILAYGKGECFVTWYPVDPETVGECTGLRDKNGKLIFEGDIVLATRRSYTVRWYVNGWRVQGKECDIPLFTYQHEIIGNIHDNPELREVN